MDVCIPAAATFAINGLGLVMMIVMDVFMVWFFFSGADVGHNLGQGIKKRLASKALPVLSILSSSLKILADLKMFAKSSPKLHIFRAFDGIAMLFYLVQSAFYTHRIIIVSHTHPFFGSKTYWRWYEMFFIALIHVYNILAIFYDADCYGIGKQKTLRISQASVNAVLTLTGGVMYFHGVYVFYSKRNIISRRQWQIFGLLLFATTLSVTTFILIGVNSTRALLGYEDVNSLLVAQGVSGIIDGAASAVCSIIILIKMHRHATHRRIVAEESSKGHSAQTEASSHPSQLCHHAQADPRQVVQVKGAPGDQARA